MNIYIKILPADVVDRWKVGRRYELSELGVEEGPDIHALEQELAKGTKHRIMAHLELPSSKWRGRSKRRL